MKYNIDYGKWNKLLSKIKFDKDMTCSHAICYFKPTRRLRSDDPLFLLDVVIRKVWLPKDDSLDGLIKDIIVNNGKGFDPAKIKYQINPPVWDVIPQFTVNNDELTINFDHVSQIKCQPFMESPQCEYDIYAQEPAEAGIQTQSRKYNNVWNEKARLKMYALRLTTSTEVLEPFSIGSATTRKFFKWGGIEYLLIPVPRTLNMSP